MKKIIIILALLMATTAFAGTATLNWDIPTTNTDGTALTDLAGFKVYYGATTNIYTSVVTVPSPTTNHYIMTLSTGTYYFAVTAYNTSGSESDFSNEIVKFVAGTRPSPPSHLTVAVTGVVLI